MDEHPGDTLGNRFLTFWGALGAIVALALILLIYRWIAVPSSDTLNDGGASNVRLGILSQVSGDQETGFNTVAEVEPGKTVRLPATALIPFAAKTLAAWKEAPGPIKTPEATLKEQEAKAKETHDPNLSKFQQ